MNLPIVLFHTTYNYYKKKLTLNNNIFKYTYRHERCK